MAMGSANTTLRPEEIVAQAIALFPEVERIILYGSRARGDNRPRSDIDLAVEADSMTIDRWFDLIDAAEEAPTLLKIDLVRLDQVPEELRKSIEDEGKVIYERA